eukprot:gene3978-biopygen8967
MSRRCASAAVRSPLVRREHAPVLFAAHPSFDPPRRFTPSSFARRLPRFGPPEPLTQAARDAWSTTAEPLFAEPHPLQRWLACFGEAVAPSSRQYAYVLRFEGPGPSLWYVGDAKDPMLTYHDRLRRGELPTSGQGSMLPKEFLNVQKHIVFK